MVCFRLVSILVSLIVTIILIIVVIILKTCIYVICIYIYRRAIKFRGAVGRGVPHPAGGPEMMTTVVAPDSSMNS